MKRNTKVSTAVIRRLPRYYRQLSELQEAGVVRISSSALGKSMGLTASQIRQDLFCFGGFGQQGYGYNVAELRAAIASIMHIDRERRAIIVGAGNLGKALMSNFNFAKYGVRLVAAFDSNPMLIGQEISGVPIFSCRSLEQVMADFRPDIAILTLPKLHARSAAQRLIASGIRGIWNFTSMDLHLDVTEVPVENIHFSESLMVLSYKIP